MEEADLFLILNKTAKHKRKIITVCVLKNVRIIRNNYSALFSEHHPLVSCDDPQKRHQFMKRGDSGTRKSLALQAIPLSENTVGVASFRETFYKTHRQSGALIESKKHRPAQCQSERLDNHD